MQKESYQPEWKRVKFHPNNLKGVGFIPKRWQPAFILGVINFGFIPYFLIGVIHGFQVIAKDLLFFLLVHLFISSIPCFLILWLPSAISTEKVAFGDERMYIFNKLNKLIGKPLCIPYSSITKLFYNPWLKIYGVDYYNEKGRKSSYGVIFTKENMERLREKLRELKEKGKWHGKLEVVPLVTVGMASIPEDEVEEFERRKKAFEKW